MTQIAGVELRLIDGVIEPAHRTGKAAVGPAVLLQGFRQAVLSRLDLGLRLVNEPEGADDPRDLPAVQKRISLEQIPVGFGLLIGDEADLRLPEAAAQDLTELFQVRARTAPAPDDVLQISGNGKAGFALAVLDVEMVLVQEVLKDDVGGTFRDQAVFGLLLLQRLHGFVAQGHIQQQEKIDRVSPVFFHTGSLALDPDGAAIPAPHGEFQ